MLDEFDIPEKIKVAIQKVMEILKSAGCTEIYLFGSIAEGRYGSDSDIDIAVVNMTCLKRPIL